MDGLKGPQGGLLGAFWDPFLDLLGPLGDPWGPLGDPLGPLGNRLGPFLVLFGLFWGPCGPLGPLRDAFSAFVRCSDQIWRIFVRFCVIFWE